MSILSAFYKIIRNLKQASEPVVVPLPIATYESMFEYIRLSCEGLVADLSSIKPEDKLVGKNRFGRDDASYITSDIQRSLGLEIPKSEWYDVETFDDMTRLLLRYMQKKRAL